MKNEVKVPLPKEWCENNVETYLGDGVCIFCNAPFKVYSSEFLGLGVPMRNVYNKFTCNCQDYEFKTKKEIYTENQNLSEELDSKNEEIKELKKKLLEEKMTSQGFCDKCGSSVSKDEMSICQTCETISCRQCSIESGLIKIGDNEQKFDICTSCSFKERDFLI